MKKLRLAQTITLQDSELLEKIENYKEFSTPTFLHCYAEIKRRALVLSDNCLIAVKEFIQPLIKK